MTILLLENDEATALRVLTMLRARGHGLHWSDEQHLRAPRPTGESYDVAIMGQSESDAAAFAQSAGWIALLRHHHPAIAVILLCGSGAAPERIAGLQAGADDCLPRHFDPDELAARIDALVRRLNHGHTGEDKPVTLRADDIEMDLLRREVTRAGRTIALMPQEFRILETLLRHRDRVVSKAMLLGAIEKEEGPPQSSLIETQISRLRTKLNRENGKDAIQTVRGAGYRIRIEA